jgi:hypothetical protein
LGSLAALRKAYSRVQQRKVVAAAGLETTLATTRARWFGWQVPAA